MLQKCLEAEQTVLDYTGVKERIIKLGHVAVACNRPESDNESKMVFDIGFTWLVGQLKVNIRPLWAPAVKAIASLVERVPGRGWEVLIEELTKAANAAQVLGEKHHRGRGSRPSRTTEEPHDGSETGNVVGKDDHQQQYLDDLGVLVPDWEDQLDETSVPEDGSVEKERTWNDGERETAYRACASWTRALSNRINIAHVSFLRTD